MHCKRVTLFLIVAVMPIILSACGAAHHSIFRNRTVRSDGPSIIAVDAKQRTILAVPQVTVPATGGANTSPTRVGQIRMCAEASPDVFSVIAQSLSATGTFGQTADPRAIEAAASIAGSTSEQGSTIPRTQTINMLRELMYRTCERYLNGAIDEMELQIQAVRDQRLMVAILAIEQLTGAVTPPTVVIGASASGSAGSSSAEAVIRLDNARKRLDDADAAQRTRQAAYDTLQNAAPSCTSIEQKAATAGQTLTTEETTKRTQCAGALAALNTAKNDRTSAAQAHEDLRTALASGGAGPATTTTSVQQGDHGSGEIARAHTESVVKVADAVRQIVSENYSQDEFGLFCLRYNTFQDQELRTACRTYLSERVLLDAARAQDQARRLYRADFTATTERLRTADERLFEAFWARVAPGSTLDRARLAAIVEAYVRDVTVAGAWGPSDAPELAELKAATTRQAAQEIFGRLSDRSRETLGRREN